MSDPAVSSAEQFRQAAAERAQRARPITLPSGLVARLLKPSPFELMMYQGSLPQSIAAVISPGTDGPRLTREDVAAAAVKFVNLVRHIFVWPKVPDECMPGVGITLSDIDWALAWSRGEVTEADAAPAALEDFRSATASGGPAGAAVPVPAV